MEKYGRIVKLWKSYDIKSVADLDRCLDSFRILFAYHSGKIENGEITYHDAREIFTNGSVSNFTGDPRALFEQRNQKACYDYLKEDNDIPVPFVETPYSKLVGNFMDKFGVLWGFMVV